MFLATDRHFTQGASDHRSLTWDAARKRLSGVFTAVADTDYHLRVLVPDGFSVGETYTSAGEPTTEQDRKVLKLAFHCAGQGEVTWWASFHYGK